MRSIVQIAAILANTQMPPCCHGTVVSLALPRNSTLLTLSSNFLQHFTATASLDIWYAGEAAHT